MCSSDLARGGCRPGCQPRGRGGVLRRLLGGGGRGQRSLVPARVGRGPEGTCRDPDIACPPTAPGLRLCCRLPSPRLRVSLSPADRRRLAKPGAPQRKRKSRRATGCREGTDKRAVGLCACVWGSTWPSPPHLRVTSWAPAWSPPLALHPAAGGGSTCRLHVDPVGTGAPPPTRPHCAGAGGQVQLGTSARLPASHPPSRHLLDFAPGWCPLWGDF